MAEQRPRRSLWGLVAVVTVASAASQWWAGWHDRSVGAEVAALARPGDIRMMSSQTCAVCRQARAWMNEHRVPFVECTIERDARCRADFEASRAPGTPLIVVRGKGYLGFDPALLRRALAAA